MIKHTSAINKYAYYVHYHASSFIRQQKLPTANALSNYAIQRVRNQAGILKSGISRAVKQEYANAISELYGRNLGKDAKLTSADIKTAQDTIENILLTQTKQFTTNDRIDWLTGRVLSGNPASSSLENAAMIQQTQFLSEEQLYNLQILIDDLQRQIITMDTNASKEKFEKLIRELAQVQKMIQQINAQQNKELRTLKGWNKGLFGAETDTSLRMNIGAKNRDLLNSLNQSIKACNLKNIILTTAQGTLGEDVAAVAADVVCGLGISHIHTTIKQGVIGNQWTNLEFNIKGMPAEVYAEALLRDVKYVKGNTAYSKQGSQGKVDVVVQLPAEKGQSGFKRVNVSMKSVDLSKDIHLVSGTNLWYLIQDENVREFLRPYLNIIANHLDALQNPDSPKGFAVLEMSAIKAVDSLRKDALLATKIITAYKALSGHTYGRMAAQLFVVNDVASKKTYVLEVNDIIRALLNEISMNQSAIDNFFTFDGINDLILNNTWQETIHARMAGIILDARNRKLSIALRNNVIKNNLIKNMAESL